MTFRIFSVLLCLLAGLSAALAAPLSAQDEARLIYLEKRLSELEGRDRELRAYADKAAKGEADGVKDIAAAQVQGAKDGLTGQLAGLNSNFNMLLGFGGVVAALLVAIFFGGAWFAKREARSVAEAEMKTMEGELKAKEGELNTMVAALKQSLETKEQEILDALQKEAALRIDAIKEAERQARESAQAAGESRDKAKEALSDMVKHPSRPQLTTKERQESERLKEETKDRPPRDLTEEQLTELTKRALADDQPAEAARYANALVGKDTKNPSALILLARARLKQNLSDEAIDAARSAIEVAQEQNDQWMEGVAHIDLGDALRAARRLQEAQEAYEQSKRIYEKLEQRQPTDPELQRETAIVWSRLGEVFQVKGDRSSAKAACLESRDRMIRLVQRNESRADWQQELAMIWGQLIYLLLDEGDYCTAKAEAIEHRDRMARLAQQNEFQPAWTLNLAEAWKRLGDVLLAEGALSEAKGAYIEFRDRMARLVRQDETQCGWQHDLAVAWNRLGIVLQDEGNSDGAKAACTEYHDRAARLVQCDESRADWRRELMVAHRRCAQNAVADNGTAPAALSMLQQAQQIADGLLGADPANRLYHQDHAWLKGVWGDYSAAVSEPDEARRLWGEAVAELTALEDAKTLDFLGQRALKEYRAKLAAA